LLAIESIRQLKATYCLRLDAHDWIGYRSLFTSDAEISGDVPLKGQTENRTYTPDQFTSAVRLTLGGLRTFHTVHAAIINVTDELAAAGLWAYTQRGFGLTGGYYREQYRRCGDAWKIAAMEFTLVHRPRLDDTYVEREGDLDARLQKLLDGFGA